MKNVGIIGATSPLGIRVTNVLVKAGYFVTAGYRRSELIPQAWLNNDYISCVVADVSDEQNITSVFKGSNVVIWIAHCSSNSSEEDVKSNVIPFEWFCSQSHLIEVKKIVFISSGGAVYGEPTLLPIPEEHSLNPLSYYGKAKKEMEKILKKYSNLTGIESAIIRPSNIYGLPLQDSRIKSVINVYLRCLYFNQMFTLIGKGETIRDFVNIDDVAQAILLAVESKEQELVWNVGTAQGYPISEVLELINKILGLGNQAIEHKPARKTDPSCNVLSIDKIKSDCGWVPKVSLEEGLVSLCDDFKSGDVPPHQLL